MNSLSQLSRAIQIGLGIKDFSYLDKRRPIVEKKKKQIMIRIRVVVVECML